MQTVGCIIFLALMSVIVIVQVFIRYIFNFSFVWAEELVRYLMIWMVMFGAALVQSKNEHIRIDFFPMLAGARARRIMEIFFRLATLIFLAVIAYKGFKVSYFNRLFESSGLRISMLWPTLAIPLGAIAIGCYTMTGLVRDIYQLFAWTNNRLQEFDRLKTLEKYQSDSENPSQSHPQEH
jgi:TRAP-type C4-dicarboxylate transport system permease small subunit